MLVISVVALVALTFDLLGSPVVDRGTNPMQQGSSKYYYHLRGSYNENEIDAECQLVRLFRHIKRDKVEIGVTLLFLLTIVGISFIERGECNSEAMKVQSKTMLKVLVEQGVQRQEDIQEKEQEMMMQEDKVGERLNTTAESPITE